MPKISPRELLITLSRSKNKRRIEKRSKMRRKRRALRKRNRKIRKTRRRKPCRDGIRESNLHLTR